MSKINVNLKIEGSAAILLIATILGWIYTEYDRNGYLAILGCIFIFVGILSLFLRSDKKYLNRKSKKADETLLWVGMIISAIGTVIYGLTLLYYTDQYFFNLAVFIIASAAILILFGLFGGGASDA